MRAAVAGLVCAALALVPSGATALPILAEPDAAELAQALADAEALQGVCYGWSITVDDPTGQFAGEEQGSSRDGPGSIASLAGCERAVLLRGSVVYTSEQSEFEDSASVSIETNLEPAVRVETLESLGFGAEGLLTDRDDENLTNMVEALPLLVAETGAAPFVPFEPRTTPLPASERPTGDPGSDWLRTFWPLLALTAVAGLAVVAVAIAVVRRLARRRGVAAGRGAPTFPSAQPPEENR